jgi:hypothetical protein
MAKIAWTNSQGGSWTTAADWSGGVVPGSADDVTINTAAGALGYYYVDTFNLNLTLHSLTLDQAAATLGLNGGSLATDLILDAGTVQLGNASLSGTIVGNGGYIDGYGGALDSETLVGSVQLADFDQMTIAGGLTFATTHHTAARLVLSATTIDVNSSETWNGGTIVLGGLNTSGSIGFLDFDTSPSTLTLGSALDVVFNSSDTIGGSATGTDTIVNDGTIEGVAGGALLLAEGTILNAGHISAGAGSSITIDAASFTNRGAITVTAGGTLSLAASHLANHGAIDIAGGIFMVAGPTATLAEFKLATFTDGGLAAFGGTISNAHRTLTLGAAAGLPSIELTYSGLIEGGTLVSNGGLTFAGGTLSGVTFETPLDLSESGATLTVTGGLAGRAATGSGPGTIMLTGVDAILDLSGVGTLSNLTIDGGAGSGTIGNNGYTGSIIELAPNSATGFTLAAGASIVQTGAVLTIGVSSYYYGVEPLFTNRGVITADVAGGQLYIQGTSFDNIGSIRVGGGDELIVQTNGAFSNTGNLDVASGGTLGIFADITTSALGSLSVATGGTLSVADTLNNTGDTLRIGAGSAIALLELGGEIEGGTIVAGSGGLFANGGSLYGVTFEGVLSVGGPGGASLNIGSGDSFTGANGSGAGSLLLTGAAASIDFLDPGPLDDVSITLASASSTLVGGNYIDNELVPLTLGSTVQITQTGQAATFGGQDIQTAATITAAVAGGTFTLTGTITNTGTIAVSNGETLVLADNGLTNSGVISLAGGVLQVAGATLADLETVSIRNSVANVSGALDLQAGTLSLANDGLSLFRVGSTVGTYGNYYFYNSLIQSGTIVDPNGLLQVAGYATFEGVTYEGMLSLTTPLASLSLLDGSSVTDATGKLAGTIVLTGAGTTLDTDSLDRATIDIGSAGLTYDGNTLSPATLEAGTLGAHITIDQTGAYAGIFEQSDDASVLTSAATIEAGVAGGVLGIWGDAVTSSGSIGVSNGETVTIGSADFLNTGVLSVAGAGSAVTLDTYAYYATDVFAPSSFANAGTLLLSGGSFTQITGGGTFPELPIANYTGARISGFGTIGAAVANDGVIEASGGTLALTQAVTGTGTLQVDAGATLQLAGVGAGSIADFSGAGGVLGLAPMAFLGTIAGFASGDTIDLASTVASAASFAHDSIVVTLTAGGTITLATSTTLTGSLTVTAGGHGDTLISYAGSGAHHTLFAHGP